MSERKAQFLNSSGIKLKSFYKPEDVSKPLEDPGVWPFARGVRSNMYRGRLWTMRQYAGFSSAKLSNERYKQLLKQGGKGLSVAFDLPTQMGYDADHIMSSGEVGRVGVSISTIEDMELLFDGIDLAAISTSMTINSTAAILLAFYIGIAKRRGIGADKLRGTVQNDLLKEFIARGTYIYPPEESVLLSADIFKHCAEHLPLWNSVSVSGYHIREAGSTAAQELAFTLSNAVAYVEAAKQAGVDLEKFGTRMSFFFNAHNNFFEEIAKFRAARRMWARIMRDQFGIKNERACKLRFHAQTAGVTLTAQEPHNNVARVSLQALAAVLGGAQSLHTNSMDEALGLPTKSAARTALRTQQIVAHETGVADVVDPLGGSYYVEHLTDALEQKAQAYCETIKTRGGVLKCINYMQNEVQTAAYAYQQALESGDEIIVGVNKFQADSLQESNISGMALDESATRDQLERLKKFKSLRNAAEVERYKINIQNAAARLRKERQALMPLIIEAVDQGSLTLGEVTLAIEAVYGRH